MNRNDQAVNASISSANGAAGKFEKSVDQVTAGAHQAIDKLSAVTHPAVDRIASGTHAAVDTLGDVAVQTAGTIGAKSRQLADIHARTVENCRAQVRDTPLLAVGFSVAIGFLLARIAKSR